MQALPTLLGFLPVFNFCMTFCCETGMLGASGSYSLVDDDGEEVDEPEEEEDWHYN